MNRGDAWCLLLVLLIMPSLSLAQGAEEQLAEARAESLTGRNDDPEGALDAEHLGIQEQRRFRLNRMGKEELMADLDLSMAEADAMLAYRARLGAFIDPMELQAVPGWSLDLVRRLLPLVRLDTMVRLVPTLRERLDGGGQQLILRLGSVVERSKGYVADSIGRRVYAGGPMRATVQYRFRFRSSLDFGFRADKDAGERWLAPGGTPDHVSAFLAVRDLGTVSTLVVGDYEVCLAQGLVVWQGMAFRKGANSMEVMRSGPVFRPHSGAEENRYMRGAAVTLRRGRWNVHLFSGMNRLDAHRIFDSASGILEFTGFQTSGLHRTVSEIRDRKSLVDIAFGGRASLSLGAFALGFNLTGHRFSGRFVPPVQPYDHFAFSGDRMLNASIDHHVRAGPLHIYGEWAIDHSRQWALTEGLMCSPGPRLDIVVQARSFSRGYACLHGSPFAESVKAQNEVGVYLGMVWRISSTLNASGHVDRYRYSWLRYGVDGPSDGFDALFRLDWRPTKTTLCYGQASWEDRPRDFPGTDPYLPGPASEGRFRARSHLEHAPSRFILLRLRAEYDRYQARRVEQGFLGYADLTSKSPSHGMSVMFRLLYYDTEGYGSRIYAYETVLPGTFSIPAHAGEGFQWSIQGSKRISRHVELGVGFRQNVMQNNGYQGTGYEMILGPNKTEWNFQIRSIF